MPLSVRYRSFRSAAPLTLGAVALLFAIPTHAGVPLPTACVGDCDGNGAVAVNELIACVNIALGVTPISQCPSCDCRRGDQVTVDCLILAVTKALQGCPPTVASPTVEGPITTGAGKPFVAGTALDLGDFGYSQAEYFLAGTAAALINTAPLTNDGAWTVRRSDAAASYKTRILVYRPIDANRFNGTVLVEWLNVSGGVEAAADWVLGHTELMREGYAYVGVSAQRAGIEGGPSLGVISLPLKMVDPVRYAPLSHPGDSFSYDMFSQVAQAIRRPSGIAPLGDLPIAAVIATGDSQSAFRLVTYIDALQPLDRLYDGFLVHSRAGNGAVLSEAPQPAIAVPNPLFIRIDLAVPVMNVQTETDLTFLASVPSRQPDTDRFRLWEIAGASHADTYTVHAGPTDRGDSPDVANIVLVTSIIGTQCSSPINSGPHHWVMKAALAALNDWVRTGVAPPIAPRLETETVNGKTTIVRDEHGNARGGVRTPYVDVPIAAFTGEQDGSILCRLFGTTTLFDDATLAALYPDHAAYVAAFDDATDRAVAGGFLRPTDAALLKAHAAQSDIGS